ncbi:hypothetical protein HRbin28_02043 [bacterium HR28]|nr:hypothetical protein HRbin28_02043 [bacterium HR28]
MPIDFIVRRSLTKCWVRNPGDVRKTELRILRRVLALPLVRSSLVQRRVAPVPLETVGPCLG